MAELKIQAPLARIEDWAEFGDLVCSSEDVENSNQESSFRTPEANDNGSGMAEGSFNDAFSESLEDLVNTFDEKITNCFYNYTESVEELAPVQMRNQEEIMNECQIWWTLTGNFGNILPIDWTKSCSKGLQQSIMNLNNQEFDYKAEENAKNGDIHALLVQNVPPEPLFTAEQVLEEIEEMIQQQRSPSLSESPEESLEEDLHNRISPYIGMYKDEVKRLSVSQLHALLSEMESLIRQNSELLVSLLAQRDELEFVKELRNHFISLVLGVQNMRRQHHLDAKRPHHRSLNEPKYLSTVIPYDPKKGTPENATLQVLIKILKAINEDSPTVPTLLTDYILRVFCPT